MAPPIGTLEPPVIPKAVSAAADGYPLTVLQVSPTPADHHALREIFRQTGWALHVVGSLGEGLRRLRRADLPIVISERDFPDGNWEVLLNASRGLPAPPRVVVSSRLADERLWSVVLNLGGFDVLTIPFERREVHHVVTHAWDSWNREQRSARSYRRRAAGA